MINVQIRFDISRLSSYAQKASLLKEILVTKINELSLRFQQKVVGEKLHGQVLKQRTGLLASSVRIEPARVSGSVVTALVSAAGGAAWYGQLHETGVGHPWEIVAVNKKALRFLLDGKAVFRHHVTHPPLPERSFMRSTFDEDRADMSAELKAAILEGLANANST